MSPKGAIKSVANKTPIPAKFDGNEIPDIFIIRLNAKSNMSNAAVLNTVLDAVLDNNLDVALVVGACNAEVDVDGVAVAPLYAPAYATDVSFVAGAVFENGTALASCDNPFLLLLLFLLVGRRTLRLLKKFFLFEEDFNDGANASDPLTVEIV